MKADYALIKYIRNQLSEYNDDKLTNVVVIAFKKMCSLEDPNGCLSTSVVIYIAMKYLGYAPKLCYGLVVASNGHEFYHAWIELNGKIIDVAIFGNANFSFLASFNADKPAVNEAYAERPNGMVYQPFVFDEDWPLAQISKPQGSTIAKYCDNAPKNILWEYSCNLLNISPTKENKDKLRAIVGDDII